MIKLLINLNSSKIKIFKSKNKKTTSKMLKQTKRKQKKVRDG